MKGSSCRPVIVFLFVLLSCVHYGFCDDEFTEELFIKPLPTGHVYSYFQFTTTWDVTNTNRFHYNLFPKSLGEILFKHKVRELHLTLSQGLWRYPSWGYPFNDAAPGMELWVWFEESTENLDDEYAQLTNALSGAFCASLNFVSSENTASPVVSFRPTGVTSNGNSSYLRYSILPSEIVCTENLTPWAKLLPCNTKAGLSTLVNAGRLFDTVYHSLGVHVRPVKQSSQQTTLELTQTVSLVSDVLQHNRNKQDWSFSKLYGRVLGSTCPLAKFSHIYVDITSNQTKSKLFTLQPPPTSVEEIKRNNVVNQYAVYDAKTILQNSKVNNFYIAGNALNSMTHDTIRPPPLHAIRFVTGFGQEFGGVRCLIHNNHPTQSITVVYMEMIPWFMRLFLHTLEINRDNQLFKPVGLHFIPAIDRKTPSHLEIAVNLPPHSVTKISIQYELTLLKWTEYPPDANHGFYIGSAVISGMLPPSTSYIGLPQRTSTIYSSFNLSLPQYFVRIHTEPLLVLLPTPDFSMPYNAICLTCTVVALAFGPIHNLTIKRLEIKDSTQDSMRMKVKTFLNKWLRFGKSKGEGSKSTETEEPSESMPADGTSDVVETKKTL